MKFETWLQCDRTKSTARSGWRPATAPIIPALTVLPGSSVSARSRARRARGFCFLFAPAYHPGMKHAALVRRQLEVRTVMNLLGPCINPAHPPVQLLGVADPKMLRRIAQTLAAIGVQQALVVHGSGLDEVALHANTRAIRLSGDEIEELEITPEDAGIERAPLN